MSIKIINSFLRHSRRTVNRRVLFIFQVVYFTSSLKRSNKLLNQSFFDKIINKNHYNFFITWVGERSKQGGKAPLIYIYGRHPVKSRGQKMNLLITLRKCSTTYSGYP